MTVSESRKEPTPPATSVELQDAKANPEAPPAPQDEAPTSDAAHPNPVPALSSRAARNLPRNRAQASEEAPATTRVPPPPLTSYHDFIHAVYGPTRRRWKPTATELENMHRGPSLDSPHRKQLLASAASDQVLKKTRDVMLFGIRRLDRRNEEKPIREFVRDVLCRHPAYASRSLLLALEHPDRSDDKRAVQIIADMNYRALRWDGSPPLSKAQASTCRVNALHCLLLWFRETLSPSLTLERVYDHLRREVWRPTAPRRVSEPDRVRALIKNRDHAATNIVCSLLGERMDDLRRQAEESEKAARNAGDRIRTVEQSLARLQEDLAQTRVLLERKTDELDIERRDREIERAHLRDDYEQLRGRVLRRVDAELSLLKEGLNALRRDPPKVAVMDDHAERAIDGLTNEVGLLRRG